MLRDQCEDYCRCDFCKKPKRERKGDSRPHTVHLASSNGHGKDALYFRTLDNTLRARCLLESSKNAHRFRPDETLQSTRGDMARAALTVPVRRRDRLQELLILENKERMRAERQLRRDCRTAGVRGEAEEVRERAVGTDSDVIPGPASGDAYAAETAIQPVCSAEEDLLYALKTIKKITDEHGEDNRERPLTSDHIRELRSLLREQDDKTKKMIASCPEKEHTYAFASTVSGKGRHRDHVHDRALPSIYGGKTQRLDYSPHPYGSGVVWLPLDAQNGGVASRRRESSEADDAAHKDFQYPGSTYNKYHYSSKASEAVAADRRAPPVVSDRTERLAPEKGEERDDAREVVPILVEKKKEQTPYKSSAALWRTTNQERAAQMQRFLEFKKLHADAAKIYAEGASGRRVDGSPAANGTTVVAARD